MANNTKNCMAIYKTEFQKHVKKRVVLILPLFVYPFLLLLKCIVLSYWKEIRSNKLNSGPLLGSFLHPCYLIVENCLQ